MNYLLNGGYCELKLEMLIEATGIRSEKIISALRWYCINGASIENAAELNEVDAANLRRAKDKINDAAGKFYKWNQLCNKSDESKQVAIVTPEKPKRAAFDPLGIVPAGINLESWSEWVQFRKDSRKKISKAAASKQFKLLLEYPEEYQKQIIDTSISNDYQGLFPLKGYGNAGSGINAGNSHAQRSASDTASLLSLAQSLENDNGFMGANGPALPQPVDCFGGACSGEREAEPQFQFMAEEDGTFIDRKYNSGHDPL